MIDSAQTPVANHLQLQKKSRRTLLMIVAFFMLPTNRGELFYQPLSLANLELSHLNPNGKWQVIVSAPQSCQKECQQVLLSVNQLRTALGWEQPRVETLAMFPAPVTPAIKLEHWQFVEPSELFRQQFASPALLIVDPDGNFVMKYSWPAAGEEMSLYVKNILVDLKKLLKYSRIG
jgi:hypothetical protein